MDNASKEVSFCSYVIFKSKLIHHIFIIRIIMHSSTVTLLAALFLLTFFSASNAALTVSSGNYTAIQNMQNMCNSVPTSTLGLCNTTCLECTSSSSSDCISCSTGYVHDSKYCQLDQSVSTYIYYQYAGNNLNQDPTKIGVFAYDKTN